MGEKFGLRGVRERGEDMGSWICEERGREIVLGDDKEERLFFGTKGWSNCAKTSVYCTAGSVVVVK